MSLCTDLLAASRDAGKDSLNGKLGMEFRCVCGSNQVSVFHVSHGRRCKEDLKTLRGGQLLSAQITNLEFFSPCLGSACHGLTTVYLQRQTLSKKKFGESV